ncbi:hypothetical protein KA001_02610, partial [Patescibacteria group bacterium]|nr:hypothetical protein [Patescibacteria group bacterium]
MNLFEDALKTTNEYGIVERVQYPLCYVSALPSARVNDTVYFEDSSLGRVIGLKKELVEIVSFSPNPPIVSKRVAYSGKSFMFGVGDDLLGKVVDPLGYSLVDSQSVVASDYFPLDAKPLEISKRNKIKKQFLTGVSIIDSLVPLGFGQRELILGDRKTGKSSLVIPLIQSALMQGVVVVYCGIGKRAVELKKIRTSLENLHLLDKVCMVASKSDSNPALIELTPFSGMALCEYFRSKKISTLLILDDLSTHAKAYREISLTAKRFPGRDSYPGDIFFKHSKLLERGGNFTDGEGGEVSITILPVAETYEGNLSD